MQRSYYSHPTSYQCQRLLTFIMIIQLNGNQCSIQFLEWSIEQKYM